MIVLTRSSDSMRLPIILNEDGREILVQLDYDWPGVASTFGWHVSMNEPFPYAEKCDHDGTDGTIDCPACGLPAASFIAAARHYLDEHEGKRAEDPGYFTEPGEPWFGDGKHATKDANGVDLGYPGPDGTTLYFRGYPVGHVTHWERIFRLLIEPKQKAKR